MRSAWVRALRALLPAAARQDLFDPAILDLYAEAARTGRGTSLGAFVVFLECWRLAPSEVFSMLAQDIRHALRLLVREPGFTLAAVLTLTLGVGANVAVFAVVNAVLLRPLPYPDAGRLLVLQHRDRRTGISKAFIAIGDYVDLRARQRSFESLAAYGTMRGAIREQGEPFDVSVLVASADLLEAMRVQPVLGRALTADDTREGAAPVLMLGYDAWQQRYGGSPSVIGRAVRVGSTTLQVVGIAPRGFRFPADGTTDAIAAITIPSRAPAQRKSDWTFAVGRLKPGVTIAQADAELAAISRQMELEHPDANQGSEYYALTLRDQMAGDSKAPLLLLLAAVSVVLLIACVNVANLLVARAVGRRQEMAVRVALGASRGRIVAQALTESLVLAALAGGAAMLIAWRLTPALLHFVPAAAGLPGGDATGLNRTVFAFSIGVTLMTAVAFGLVTASGVRVDNAVGALVNPGRVTVSAAARRASAALVIVETALAIVLLTAAGLVLRSFGQLLSIDPGFRTDHILTMDLSVPAARYQTPAARGAFQSRLLDTLRHASGVEDAGTAAVTPLTGNNWTVGFERADQRVPAGQRPPDVGWQAASGTYFTTLGIPLKSGRLFGPDDRVGGAPVVIVSEAIQDRFFHGTPAVGAHIVTGDGQAEIVGVVGNIRRAALTDQPRADLYFPAEQQPASSTTLFVRATGDAAAGLSIVKNTLHRIEPLAVLRNVRTLDDIAGASMQMTRLTLWVLGAFAAMALALASVGIYGVMSYSVRQRTREIGTRLALGASPRDILFLVIRDGLVVAAIGAGVGLAGGLATARVMSALLYHASPRDPLTLSVAIAVLLAVALAACYIPARRASRVDPVRTLAQ